MRKSLYLIITLIIFGCEYDSPSTLVTIKNSDIQLKWNKAYTDDTIDKSIIGLKWASSYIGATLPSNGEGVSYSNNIISLEVNKLGFPNITIEKLNQLHSKIIASDEYQKNKTVDLGRYVTLLLSSSTDYYELVGTAKTLNEVLSGYTLKPEKGYINNSSVSLEHRIIRFSEQTGLKQLFLSQEVSPTIGEIYEYETIESLPNGQLRFGIFDVNGNRKINADVSHSNAGKPGKCMWCHESTINPLFTPQNDFSGYLTANELQSTLINYRDQLLSKKISLPLGVDFTQTQQHTFTELLYISFMEPSAERLSIEWNLPIAQIQNLLTGLPTHTYPEFPFLGNLYHRSDIEALAPFRDWQFQEVFANHPLSK